MTTLRIEPVAHRLLGEPNRAKSSKKQLRYGTHGSLCIDLEKDTWYDHESNTGGGVLDLICRETGCANGDAVEWLQDELGIQAGNHRKILATFDYHDEHGEMLYQVVRYDPKDFRQRRPNGRGGWIWSVKGIRKVPYRLFELQAQSTFETVFIVEGEKQVDRLAALGYVATCNAQGAGAWTSDLNEYFRGKTVYILPDNDDAGRDHATDVAQNLHGIARSIRIVELPKLPPKGDIINWLDNGGDPDLLIDICESFPEWTPSEVQQKPSTTPDISQADARRWANRDPDPLQFVVEDLVPKGMVTLQVADGGAGKSLLAQEGMTAVASGKRFLDLPTQSGAAAGIFAEDPDNVLHLRQKRINAAFDITMAELAGKHFAQSYCGLDSVLWRDGATTELFSTIEKQLANIPDLQLFIIDNAAQIYAGNENDRMEVTQFIAALTGLAMRLNIGLILTFHTSKTSDDSVARAGSGSTAWIWACRSVLKLDHGQDDEAVLTLLKSNHTKPGQKILLMWQDAVLIKRPDLTSFDQRARKHRLDRFIFERVHQAWDSDWPLSPNSQAGDRYLPKSIARSSDFSAKEAKEAMLTHITAGNLKVDRKSARKPSGLRVENDPFEGCV